MQAVEELWQAYRDWKYLTQREGAAIQGLHWTEVHDAQNRKRALQAEIIRLTDKAKAELHSDSASADFDQRLRQLVNELILLETQNNLTVEACIASAQSQKRELDATSQRLRQVHSRYVPSRQPSWENRS